MCSMWSILAFLIVDVAVIFLLHAKLIADAWQYGDLSKESMLSRCSLVRWNILPEQKSVRFYTFFKFFWKKPHKVRWDHYLKTETLIVSAFIYMPVESCHLNPTKFDIETFFSTPYCGRVVPLNVVNFWHLIAVVGNKFQCHLGIAIILYIKIGCKRYCLNELTRTWHYAIQVPARENNYSTAIEQKNKQTGYRKMVDAPTFIFTRRVSVLLSIFL